MPEPQANETQNDYVGRCVSYVVRESGGRVTGDHAVAKCYGIWRQHKKKEKKEK